MNQCSTESIIISIQWNLVNEVISLNELLPSRGECVTATLGIFLESSMMNSCLKLWWIKWIEWSLFGESIHLMKAIVTINRNSARRKLSAGEIMWLRKYCCCFFLFELFPWFHWFLSFLLCIGNWNVIEFPNIEKPLRVWTNEFYFHSITEWSLNGQAICPSNINLVVFCFAECLISILLSLILLYWNSSIWKWELMWLCRLVHSELWISINGC